MDCLISEQELRILGGLAFVFIILSVWVDRAAIPVDIDGFKRAGLALQLSGTGKTVQDVIGKKDNPDREQLRKGLRRDFVLILSYASFFVALGLLLSGANTSGARWLGITAAILVLGAAAFDVIENYRTFEILSLDKESVTDSLARTLRTISTLKWLLLFLCVGLEAVILIKLMNLYSLIGLVMILSAIAGVAGVRFPPLITPALIGLGLSVIALGLVLLAIPQKFLRLFC